MDTKDAATAARVEPMVNQHCSSGDTHAGCDPFPSLPKWEDWVYADHSDFENAYHDAAVRPDECRRILGLPPLGQGDAQQ